MTVPARVLVVEDEDAIRTSVVAALRDAGYRAEGMADAVLLEQVVTAFRPDLAVVDVLLPGPRSGFDVAKEVRSRCDAGVVVLTALDQVADRLRGFQAGADDYLVKPFAMAELLARVGAVLRRLGRVPATVEVGDLVLDGDAGDARRAGEPLELTATELRLLSYLVANRSRTVSKTQILTQVWGYGDYDPNLVEVHVSALRRKTERHGPRLIHTVRGLGYTVRP